MRVSFPGVLAALKPKYNQENTGDVPYGTSPVLIKSRWTAVVENVLSFFSKRKWIPIAIALLLVLSIPRQFIAINIPNGVGMPENLAHQIGSVAFDRWDMNRVNRIEIKFNDTTIETIYDRRFIRQLTSQTVVARQTGFQSGFGRFTLSLYRDYDIVRVMELCEASARMVRVYWPSSVHRFFWTSNFNIDCSHTGGGMATLSRPLAEEIWHIIVTSPYTAHLFLPINYNVSP